MSVSLAVLAPVLPKLIPVASKVVVRLVEKLKGKGNGSTEKKPLAETYLAQVFGAIDAAVPGLGLPQGAEIGALVDKAVAALNEGGQLKGVDTSLDPDEAHAAVSPEVLLLCAGLMEVEAARLRKAAR